MGIEDKDCWPTYVDQLSSKSVIALRWSVINLKIICGSTL